MPVSSNRKLEFPRMEVSEQKLQRGTFLWLQITVKNPTVSDLKTPSCTQLWHANVPKLGHEKKQSTQSAHKTWNTKKSWWISQPKDAISKNLSLDSSIDFNNSEPLPLRPLTPMMRVGILSTNDMVEVGACHQVIAGRFTMAPMTSKGWTVSKPIYHRICLKHPLRTYLNV